MESKILKKHTTKQKYETKLRYLNGNDQNMYRPNRLHFGVLGQRFKNKFLNIPQKITTMKYVHKRHNAKIGSDASEYINEEVLLDNGKYDIDNEYVLNPEYTIQPPDTDEPIRTDKFAIKQINDYQQDTLVIDDTRRKINDIDLLNFTFDRLVTSESMPEYRRQETIYDRIFVSTNKTARPTITTTGIVINNKMLEKPIVRKPKDKVPAVKITTVAKPIPKTVVSNANVFQKFTNKPIAHSFTENKLLRSDSSGILHINK